MDSVPILTFDWESLDDLDDALAALKPNDRPKRPWTDDHCHYLYDLADELEATETAIDNAKELGGGHGDLSIILQEPADEENNVPHSEHLPSTISYINNELALTGEGRTWKNTCILDIRPFRSHLTRKRDLDADRHVNDKKAYTATEKIVNDLKPDVIIVCQSASQNSDLTFARDLSSATTKAGNIRTWPLRSGKKTIVVYSLHPMYAAKFAEQPGQDRIIGKIRRAMIRFTFLQALNILSGRYIEGPGIAKLRDSLWAAQQNPHALLESGRIDRSRDNRMGGDDFEQDGADDESSALIEELEQAQHAELLHIIKSFGGRPVFSENSGDIVTGLAALAI